jgi:enamine deaminase RidA (YjgF/YER057c/UK114 family)
MSTDDRQVITAGPWPARYTFVPAVRAGNLVFLSGTTATDDEGHTVAPGDIVAQTRQIYRIFERLLATVGATCRDIVSTTEFITTTENYRATADVRREVFGDRLPTSTGVIVAGLLRPGAVIEMSAIAVLPAAAAGLAGDAARGAPPAGTPAA